MALTKRYTKLKFSLILTKQQFTLKHMLTLARLTVYSNTGRQIYVETPVAEQNKKDLIYSNYKLFIDFVSQHFLNFFYLHTILFGLFIFYLHIVTFSNLRDMFHLPSPLFPLMALFFNIFTHILAFLSHFSVYLSTFQLLSNNFGLSPWCSPKIKWVN